MIRERLKDDEGKGEREREEVLFSDPLNWICLIILADSRGWELFFGFGYHYYGTFASSSLPPPSRPSLFGSIEKSKFLVNFSQDTSLLRRTCQRVWRVILNYMLFYMSMKTGVEFLINNLLHEKRRAAVFFLFFFHCFPTRLICMYKMKHLGMFIILFFNVDV